MPYKSSYLPMPVRMELPRLVLLSRRSTMRLGPPGRANSLATRLRQTALETSDSRAVVCALGGRLSACATTARLLHGYVIFQHSRHPPSCSPKAATRDVDGCRGIILIRDRQNAVQSGVWEIFFERRGTKSSCPCTESPRPSSAFFRLGQSTSYSVLCRKVMRLADRRARGPLTWNLPWTFCWHNLASSPSERRTSRKV